jgi:hypothetical protein
MKTEDIKAALEAKLQSALPAGSFSVILRTYQGDFRARTTNQTNYTAMILVDDQGRRAALARKQDLESMGFRVSAKGDISAN